MVDPIEIKLDEIEETQQKTWADVQRLMRDFSRPETKKEMLAQLPGGSSGGIFDAAINKLVGKVGGGSGGALATGMAGGMAAGGIMALVQIIGEALSSSKILMTTLKLISTALGLLIDVILLPFLPILVMGILWLFRGIMLFHQLWSKIWNSNVIQGLKKAIEVFAGVMKEGLGALIQIAFVPLVAAAAIAWSVLQWLWGVFTKDGGNLGDLAIGFAFGPLFYIVQWLYDVFNGFVMLGALALDFALGPIGDLLKWLWDAQVNGIKITLDFVSKAAESVMAAAGTAGDWLSGFLSGGWLPSFADGGTVPGSGPVPIMAHGGETVSKSGQGGNNTWIFQGYDDSKLKKTVESILRQEQYRYNP